MKEKLMILFLFANTLSFAENRMVRPNEIMKFDNVDIEKTLDLLVGEVVSLDFTDCKDNSLDNFLHFLNKDTTWIKGIRDHSKAKLGKHYILSNIPVIKEEIEKRKFIVKHLEVRIVGEYRRDFYKDVYLQDVDNNSSILVWEVKTSSNYSRISNPNIRIRISKYQDMVNKYYVDGQNYYILDDYNCSPSKENGYTHYVCVKCTECDWYLGGSFLSPIYVSTYNAFNGMSYVYNEYTMLKSKLPIYEKDYLNIVANAIQQLTESGTYYYSLAKVTKPKNSLISYGESKEVKSNGSFSKFLYEDNLISILWNVVDKECNFVLKNKSNNTIKVVWDDVSFIDENNLASKIFHNGVRYIDANNSQPSTSIPKGAELVDLLAPTNKIRNYNGWYRENLINHNNMFNSNLVGRYLKILLPIEVKGVVNEYEFTFKINWKYSNPEYHQDLDVKK